MKLVIREGYYLKSKFYQNGLKRIFSGWRKDLLKFPMAQA